MKKIAIPVVLLAGLAWFAGRAESAMPDRLAGELMVKSGLHEQIRQFPLVIRTSFQVPGAAPAEGEVPADVARLNWIVSDVFDPQKLGQGVRQRLMSGLTQPEAETVLTWLNSPLGRRVTAMEEAASTPKAYAEIAAMGERGAEGVSSERLHLVKRLEDAIRAEDHFVDMAMNAEIAVASAAVAVMGADDGTFDQIADRVEAERPRVKARMKQDVLNSFIYSYRALSDDELGRYVAFAESETGRKYHRVAFDALKEVLLEASRRAGSAIEWGAEPDEREE